MLVHEVWNSTISISVCLERLFSYLETLWICLNTSKLKEIIFLQTTGQTLPPAPLPHDGYGYFYRIATKGRIRDGVHRAEFFFWKFSFP